MKQANTKELSAKILGPLVTGSADRQRSTHRAIVLLVTFTIYATYRMSRRPLSIAKSVLHAENCTLQHLNNNKTAGLIFNGTEAQCGWAPFNGHHGKEVLGLLDSSFLFLYAFSMFAAGYVAERVNIRYFLFASLTSCGLLSVLLGLAKEFEVHSLWYFMILQVLMGLSQTGLPAVISVVGNWYGSSKKGLIFGFWNWHTSVGNIVGAAIAGAFVETDWSLSFIVPGVVCILVAGMVFLLLIPKPSDVGLAVELSSSNSADKLAQESAQRDIEKQHQVVAKTAKESLPNNKNSQKSQTEAISILSALSIPGVIEFSACLFFTKLVSYTFLYWLPLYLKETSNFSSANSAYASIMFDVGGCLGSVGAGLLADRTGCSALTCILFLICSVPSMYSYYLFSSASIYLNQGLQFITGALINGPFSLIMASVSANLACKVPSKSAMATVSAIINGTGTIGAAIGPSLAGIVSESSWKNVFWMCIVADVLATTMLARIGAQEVKEVVLKRNKKVTT